MLSQRVAIRIMSLRFPERDLAWAAFPATCASIISLSFSFSLSLPPSIHTRTSTHTHTHTFQLDAPRSSDAQTGHLRKVTVSRWLSLSLTLIVSSPSHSLAHKHTHTLSHSFFAHPSFPPSRKQRHRKESKFEPNNHS